MTVAAKRYTYTVVGPCGQDLEDDVLLGADSERWEWGFREIGDRRYEQVEAGKVNVINDSGSKRSRMQG